VLALTAGLEQAVTTLRIALAGPDPAVTAHAKVNLASVLLTAHGTGIGPPDPLGEAVSLMADAALTQALADHDHQPGRGR
jgi:hypothetical protein